MVADFAIFFLFRCVLMGNRPRWLIWSPRTKWLTQSPRIPRCAWCTSSHHDVRRRASTCDDDDDNYDDEYATIWLNFKVSVHVRSACVLTSILVYSSILLQFLGARKVREDRVHTRRVGVHSCIFYFYFLAFLRRPLPSSPGTFIPNGSPCAKRSRYEEQIYLVLLVSLFPYWSAIIVLYLFFSDASERLLWYIIFLYFFTCNIS